VVLLVIARLNPFRDSALARLDYLPARESVPMMLDRLESLGGRACIVGDHGTGKSTLLRAIEARLRYAGRAVTRLRIDGSLPNLDEVPDDVVLLIDGGESLGFLDWRRLLAMTRVRRLVATLHRPRSLPVLCRCEPRFEVIERIVRELAPDDAARLLPHARRLFEQHHGNAHEVLRGLYLLCAEGS
jgi:hypothetical protein